MYSIIIVHYYFIVRFYRPFRVHHFTNALSLQLG